MCRKFRIPALCLAALLMFSACGGRTNNETPTGDVAGSVTDPDGSLADTSADVPTEAPTESVTEPETLSPEEQAKKDAMDFLATVSDHRYELTGMNEPFYVGRWFEKEIEGVSHRVTLSDGSQIYFLIEGAASFDIDFTVITTSEMPYFTYIIDGGDPVRQHITEPTVTLPDTGKHLVQIVADGMTEGEGKWRQEKGFAVRAITPSEGGTLTGVKPVNKVIFFFGDSITEGIRALNMNATSDGNSATNAYPFQTGKVLHTVTYPIGYGASGIIQPGSFQPMMKAIDYYSYNRPVNDGFYPDIIVINHGTNDAGHPAATFEGKLEETVNHLREVYPDVPVVYLIPFNQAMASSIRKVMEGVPNGYVIETRGWRLSYTDGVHPAAEGARLAGEKLAAALIEIFGEEFFA